MVLTRKGKKRIIKVLKKAKPFVAEGSSVWGAVRLTNSIPADIYFAQDYIMDLIHPRFYVTEWLYIQHGIKLNVAQSAEYQKQWIDHMIEELRK
jgi:hypothetical protein